MEDFARSQEGQPQDELENLSPEELRERLRREMEQRRNLESLVGRQGNELGQLRKAVDELTQRLAVPSQPQYVPAGRPEEEDAVIRKVRDLAARVIIEPEEVLPEIVRTAKEAAKVELARELQTMQQVQVEFNRLAGEFYTKHPDLRQWSDVVAVVAQQLASRSPTADPRQLLDETARIAREWIGTVQARLKQRASAPPREAITTGGGRSAPVVEGQEAATPTSEDELRAFVEEHRRYRAARLNMRPPRQVK